MTTMRCSTLAAILALVLQACAELPVNTATSTFIDVECEHLFQQLDRTVSEYGVADAGTARIPGFPELRANRFLVSFANENLSAPAYSAWLDRLRQLDATARKIEWRNLPPVGKLRLQDNFGPNIETALNMCGHILSERDLLTPNRRSQLLDNIEAPHAYSTWQRALGLYFLTRWAVIPGVWRVHQEMRQPFLKAQPGDRTRMIHYAPRSEPLLDTREVAAILTQSAHNPLAIPEPSEQQLQRLFATFAPTWIVDTASDADSIGTVRLGRDGKPYIDSQAPSVYSLASHTRYKDQVLLQLNYIIWFPARPPESLLDIYAGRFDGLIWRVTLNTDGRPLAYDSIHPCGCYYQIFPGAGMRTAQPRDGSEPILSPTPILGPKSGERLMIKIAARTHFIDGIAAGKPEPASQIHEWRDYDDLRDLPLPGGGHSSLFDNEGLIPESERPERFLLWPMGVPSAGAMRQWGTHAIAFIGKRHFDDPWLLEKLLRPLWEEPNEHAEPKRTD